MRIAVIAAAVSGLLAAGCCSDGPASARGLPVLSFTERIYFFVTPKELRDETAHPPELTRQILRWEGERFQWKLTFPSNGYAYAGLELRQSLDLTNCMDHGSLNFTVTPAHAVRHLSVGLVDGPRSPHRVMVHQLVTGKPIYVNTNIALVDIPLTRFPSQGVVLDAESAEESIAAFDPGDVREVRIVTAGGLDGAQVVIGQLRIEH